MPVMRRAAGVKILTPPPPPVIPPPPPPPLTPQRELSNNTENFFGEIVDKCQKGVL